jgi:hypothetical protein
MTLFLLMIDGPSLLQGNMQLRYSVSESRRLISDVTREEPWRSDMDTSTFRATHIDMLE